VLRLLTPSKEFRVLHLLSYPRSADPNRAKTEMPVFSHHDYDAHERVLFINNEKACLRAIIAVHNTNRRPSLGGCRLKRYDSEDVALSDALRLSRAMTYKAAAADIALGGGKSVILDNGRPFDRVKLFEAMAEAVDKLQGDYIVSNDLGTTVHDVAVMRHRTQHRTQHA